MTRAERYLEREAERVSHQLAQERSSSRRPAPTDLQSVPLRDAPQAFRTELLDILRQREPTSEPHEGNSAAQVHTGINLADFVDFSANAAANRSGDRANSFTATVVGGSQQGKTSMLNSLLKLFGFDFGGRRVFTDKDLLPSHSKNGTGLPFPVRLEYHPTFELVRERWTEKELEAVMHSAVDKALDKDLDFFEDIELADIDEGSFLAFASKHAMLNEDGKFSYIAGVTAAENLNADGGSDSQPFVNTSLDGLHQQVFSSLLAMVEQQWYRYKRVTLRCPSQLLKQMEVGSSHSGKVYIVDLPGVGIVHDDNCLVEELVFRDVGMADTIIVLTGQRSFTQDIISILRNSVFERLLDRAVVPPPTVAVTNSQNLVGMQEAEMEQWRQCTLNGDMGWFTELATFAGKRFSNRESHRVFTELEPSLFPNDLKGFVEGSSTQDVGVAVLVGYFMRLPQQTLVALVTDVLERANAYTSMVDFIWKAPRISHDDRRPSRLAKEATENRKQEFQMALMSKLKPSQQKEMFNLERNKSLEQQLEEMDQVTQKELVKLQTKFNSLKKNALHMKEEGPQLVKQALSEMATAWDVSVGRVAFESFLEASRGLALQMYEEWVPKMFLENSRSETDPKIQTARATVLNTLQARVPKVISSSSILYTFTDSFRQMVRNLDAKELFSRSRTAGVTSAKVLGDMEALVRTRGSKLQEQVEKYVCHPHDSLPIKELVSRMKILIVETFDACVKNFSTVATALESIALGKATVHQDPVVILQRDLSNFTKELDKYLKTYELHRDQFGAEELKAIRKARTWNTRKNQDVSRTDTPSERQPKRLRM